MSDVYFTIVATTDTGSDHLIHGSIADASDAETIARAISAMVFVRWVKIYLNSLFGRPEGICLACFQGGMRVAP